MRRAAQVLEGELRDVRSRERDLDRSTPDCKFPTRHDVVARIDTSAGRFEELVELGLVLGRERVEIDAG